MAAKSRLAAVSRWLARIGFVLLSSAVLVFLGSRKIDVQLGVIWYHGPARIPVALLLADVLTTIFLLIASGMVLGYVLIFLWRAGWKR